MGWLVFVTAADLPDRIPLHFDFAGTPNRWGSKSSLMVLMLAALAVSGIFYLTTRLIPWIRRHPKLINMPEKERFLKLPEEKQMVYWNVMYEFLIAFATCLNFVWVMTIWGTIHVASGKSQQLPVWSIAPGLVLILLMLFFYLRRVTSLPGKLLEGQP